MQNAVGANQPYVKLTPRRAEPGVLGDHNFIGQQKRLTTQAKKGHSKGVSLANFPALKKLPDNQKLKWADELWRSGIRDSMAVPAEQKSMLDLRWAAYRAGEIKRISMSELERRLARK